MMLSLTRLCKEVDASLDIYTALDFLKDEGYVTDIRTPTDIGQKKGIEFRETENGAIWLAYDVNVFKPMLAKHFSYNLAPEYEESPKHQNTLHGNYSQVSIQQKTEHKYPYLGIDDFIVLDTETTGLSAKDEIIELGIIDANKNVIYHNYFIPQVEVNKKAEEVNHLNKKILAEKGAVLFKDEIENIKRVIEGKTILGHNISFDMRMLSQTSRKYDIDYSPTNDTLDTQKIARKYIKTKSYGLNNLTNLVGITREETHEATDDCIMTLDFLNRLEALLSIKNEIMPIFK